MSNADWLWQGLTVMSSLLAVLVSVKVLIGKPQKTEIQQPLEVREASQFITKSECSLAHRDSERRFQQIERRMDAYEQDHKTLAEKLLAAGEDRARRIYERVDALAATVNQTKSVAEISNQRLIAIEAEMHKGKGGRG